MNTGYNNIKWKDPRLARFISLDFEHIEKYPLRLETVSTATPIILGVNWYSNFDTPIKDKNDRWWIGKGELGRIRGGHAIPIPHKDIDTAGWYKYYNQGNEGACVDFSITRAMSIFNRRMYKKFWLWDRAKEIDEWEDTNPGDNNGTSVNAGLRALKTLGHIRKGKEVPDLKEGISAFRWVKDLEDIWGVLQNPYYKKIGTVHLLNLWC